jgi:low temperature requirement protein LtrA
MSAEKLHHTTLKVFAPRDPQESHRAATPLDLLFDLVFVVAIASAGQQLHHAMVEGHLLHDLPTYFMVFFCTLVGMDELFLVLQRHNQVRLQLRRISLLKMVFST